MQTEKIINHIVDWLKQTTQQAKMQGFIIGISGGIDSALVSTLAAKTGLKTLLLEMPIHQNESETKRGKEHIDFLKNQFSNVESKIVDLTSVFDTFQNQVDKNGTNSDLKDLALANSRSRLRMTTLYYFAQINNLLVTGTGNKIEDFGIGFFTKYGDGGVDISPIADLTKTQVFELSRALNISNSILNAPPTDGLFDSSRTDEQQIGATYPELEWAMEIYENPKKDDFTERQKEVFEIYDRMHRNMQHKINKIPVCQIPKEFLVS